MADLQSAARELWSDVIQQAEKDGQYFGNGTDYAGEFRNFRAFFPWLKLSGYTPGMEIVRKKAWEPFSPCNCELIMGAETPDLADQVVKMAEYISATPQNAKIVVEGTTLHDISIRYGVPKSTLLFRYHNMGARTIGDLVLRHKDNAAKRIGGKTISEISAESGVPKSTIRYRIAQGITDIDSISKPYNARVLHNPDGSICNVPSDVNHKLNAIYTGMRERCYKKSSSSYCVYGGRGIKVCDEWNGNFPAFREWALHHGYSSGLTIERIDPDKDYCPENCRWATWTEQACNKQHSIYTVLRVRAGEAREWLAKYPKHGIVTIIVRNDIMPPNPPEQCDYET